MMAQRNSFINGIGLTEANLLIHLLNNDDTEEDNELHLIKHSAYYGENEFSKLLSSKAGMFRCNQKYMMSSVLEVAFHASHYM